MLLAEALARRAEAQDRLNKLQERLVQGAMIQEGDTPVEDPAAMLEEAAALLAVDAGVGRQALDAVALDRRELAGRIGVQQHLDRADQ